MKRIGVAQKLLAHSQVHTDWPACMRGPKV
jgi:hypothetical protein